jgi:hypothetical protein
MNMSVAIEQVERLDGILRLHGGITLIFEDLSHEEARGYLVTDNQRDVPAIC